MRVVPVPCLKDNYAYLVIDEARAAVVDPSEAAPVEAALAREGVTLEQIWLTHHHWDHVGGVADLAAARPGLEVIASTVDTAKIKGVTRSVDDGATFTLGSLTARVLANPGHTLGAITFVVGDAAFTGDTLFCGGCGRGFEGDAAMMHASLQKLAALPPSTRIWCGHEYTASNLRFAAAVEPDNADVTRRAAALTVPSVGATLAEELATNPFLRVPDAAEFARRRTWKDTFK